MDALLPSETPPDISAFFTETEAQRRFAEAAFSGEYRYMLYGGGIRSGKTALALMLVQSLALVYPGSRWAIVRKDMPSIRRNVLPAFAKFRIDGFTDNINYISWSASCRNGSTILFVNENIEGDPDLDAWKGLEVNGFVLEEANELSPIAWYKAIERAGSWVIPNGEQPHPYIFATCNPALGWVKEVFHDPWKRGALHKPYYFQPATVVDNPYISAEYRESLKSLREQEYRRFVLGDWDALAEAPGALWKPDTIMQTRVSELPETLKRVVVAIDPAVSSSADSDETGIIVFGQGKDGHGYVIADGSGKYRPHEWATKAIQLYRQYNADRIIGESNNGGDMVEATLRAIDASIPFRKVVASRGKAKRAEPIAALYEQRLIHHVGTFDKLEQQMTAWTPDEQTFSPDRMDALVWAASWLMLKSSRGFLV